jgi:DNA-binding NtrC family response regulator
MWTWRGYTLRVTVVDEGSVVAESARRVLLSSGVKLTAAASLHELPLIFETNGSPDCLIVNVAEGVSGWELAARIHRIRYRGRVIAVVGSLDDPAVRNAAQLPRTQCVLRQDTPARLDEVLRAAVLDGRREPDLPAAVSQSAHVSFRGIVGRSPRMLDIFSRIEKVASGDANVCIYGESGTGKELIARAIHYLSPRRDRPMITLDCTTIPEGLMESHLLGHVRGAFTGALEQREGVFSLAHTGTLFIDELCELELPLQGKLLRAVQNREFVPVGGTKPVRTDIRLITATNKDPKQEVEQGTFREDLYYRVAVFLINVPPLRERQEDIPLLVEHFLKKFSALYRKAIEGVEPRAMKRLLAAPWPGNIRHLENFLEQAFVVADGRTLTEADLFNGDVSETAHARPSASTYEPGLPLREVERRHILRTLQKVNGNRAEAARALQISVRCLQYKLKEYVGSTPLRRRQSL